ncbi:MAG: bifunctional ornithine acetyltransferase/N-acetylglutamate synthase [Chloroflexi bacterium]|nr:MAG: bifunctional ornithine acetyltransferase/N-acetylglutamate synthase [Chloroflexota bacterium]
MTFEDWALKPTGDLVGYSVGAAAAGVRDGKPSRLDVALIVSELPCAAAGVFTTNQVIAAPCIVTRRHLERGPLRAIVVNSGNANACTGEQGERDAIAMAEAAADKIGCDPHEVAVASTGVIGVPLPVERIASAIRSIDLRKDAWDDVARAMMTTDTRPKSVRRDYPLGTLGSPETVHFRGVAKGAGMIHPNMATMWISVDGDTSTNDMVLVLTNGASGFKPVRKPLAMCAAVLGWLCEDLAQQILADGEGVTRVFKVLIRGAASDVEAMLAARTITTSTLVKTAIHGADPNWGRILAAAGRSGAKVDQTRATVRIGDVNVFESGAPRSFDRERIREIFSSPGLRIAVDLGVAKGKGEAWGTDLSEEYVRINADYTT